MKQFYTLLLSFILFISNNIAQIDTSWTGNYGGIYGEIARQVLQTSDGGYIMVGETGTFGPGTFSVYVVKTDSLGILEWDKSYGGAAMDFPYGIVQTSDNGYAIATYTTSFGPQYTNLRLIRLDAQGDTIWNSLLPGSNGMILNTKACITKDAEGGFLIAAYGWKAPKANQICLFGTDSLGNELWSAEYGGSVDDYGAAIQSLNDGNFVLAGYTYSYGNGQCDGYIIKIEPKGDTLWTNTYGGSSYDSFRFIKETKDKGFIAVGSTQSYGNAEQAYVVKTDSMGNEEWHLAFGGSQNEAFEGVCETLDGYLLTGFTNSSGAGQHDALIVRLDKEGTVTDQKTYGTTGDDFGGDIEMGSDSSYFSVGSIALSNGYTDFWLMKLVPDTISVSVENITNIPNEIILHQNYPNPFNPSTGISYSLPKSCYVKLSIYNSLGEEVITLVDAYQGSGIKKVTWNGRNKLGIKVSSGIYFYTLTTEEKILTKKMILLK